MALSLPVFTSSFESQVGKRLLQIRFEFGDAVFELRERIWTRKWKTGQDRRADLGGSHGGGLKGTAEVPRMMTG
jgi:hypothetical protein